MYEKFLKIVLTKKCSYKKFFLVKPRNVLSFTIQHFLAFANETEPIECSSKLEDIGPQVFKLFGNLDLKSDRRDSVRSQGPVKKLFYFLKRKKIAKFSNTFFFNF